MIAHKHIINREKFLAEMQRRGWALDAVGWIVPEGRRQHDKEADWYQSILIAIECECPVVIPQEKNAPTEAQRTD